jgi:hypothetical protein
MSTNKDNTGYINGYRWGVEYPTNGKRPDLDGDVVVEMRHNYGAWHGDGPDALGNFHCKSFCAFRITDQRYKPADTSYLETPALEPVPQEEGWYDYDNQKAIALPPVGVECLTWFDDGKECWQKCKVLALSPYEKDHMAVSLVGRYDRKLVWSQDFKPLDHNRKAEAEKDALINAATDILYKHACATKGELIDGAKALYDAGYLVLPKKE